MPYTGMIRTGFTWRLLHIYLDARDGVRINRGAETMGSVFTIHEERAHRLRFETLMHSSLIHAGKMPGQTISARYVLRECIERTGQPFERRARVTAGGCAAKACRARQTCPLAAEEFVPEHLE